MALYLFRLKIKYWSFRLSTKEQYDLNVCLAILYIPTEGYYYFRMLEHPF